MSYTQITETEVKAIMEDHVDESRLTIFIRTAKLTVDNLLVGKATYTDATLTEIQLYLAAHYAASTVYRQSIREENLTSNVSYNSIKGIGLDATMYGQQVKILDSDNILSDLSKNRAVFRSLNYDKEPC